MTFKRFLKIQIIFAILLSIVLIGNTYSWATRPAVMGGGFMNSAENDFAAIEFVTPDYYVNGNSCTAVTYIGTRNEETGIITYDETNPIVEFTDNDFTKGEVHYFKTVIENTTDVPTHVSLFINGYTANTLAGARLGVSSPVTSRTTLLTVDVDRNFEFIPVVSQYEVNVAKDGTPGSSNVEWYIFFDEGEPESNHGELNITNIILTNN